MHPRITVIGCGLSGMITALSFAARGINSTIIERQNIRPLSKLATARQVQGAHVAQNRNVHNAREHSSTEATGRRNCPQK